MKTLKSITTFILLSLFAVVLGKPAIAVWDIETVDSSGEVGWYCSLAIDSSNVPHIAYYHRTNYDLKYAKWNGTSWETEIVDGTTRSCGQYASIDLDTSGNPHIAYQSVSITCANWTGSAWNIVNTGSNTTVGYGASLAVGSDDSIHISYANSGYDYMSYAGYNGSSWTNTMVDSTSPMESSIKVDGSNYPWIGYLTNSDNVYIRQWNGAAWIDNSPPTTPETDGYWPDLELDTSGNQHVSFARYTLVTTIPYNMYNGDLRYYRHNGTSWEPIAIVDPQPNTYSSIGWYSSLALDNSDNAHISYHDNYNWRLKYASNSTGPWVTQTIDPLTAQYFNTSIQLDGSQNPHIAYYDQVNQDLKYASWIAGAYTVGGTIMDGVGNSISGVFVTLSGNGISSNTITDANGTYSFAALPANGTNTYTVTPMLAGYIFSPANHTYDNLITNHTSENFMIMQASGYFIRGYLIDDQDNALPNALVTLSGDSAGTCQVGASGYYEFINLPAGTTYNLRPSKFGYTFTPESMDYPNISSNQDSQDYVGVNGNVDPTPEPTVTVFGYVMDDSNEPVSDVTVQLTGEETASDTTDDQGAYSFGLPSGNFVIQSQKANWTFYPALLSFVVTSEDVENERNITNSTILGRHNDNVAAPGEMKIVPSVLKPGTASSGLENISTISFDLSDAGHVIIKVYSIDGVLVKVLLDEDRPAGVSAVQWAGANMDNEALPSGIYFVDIKTPTYRKMKKICIVK
jgi:Carboxypeptidase regulatory-like domain